MFRFVIIVCAFSLTTCSRSGTPKISIREVTGTATQRVADVSAIITKHQAPPTAILDAHFLEEQIGDGFLGPSDFRAFYVVEVTPSAVLQWTQLLTSLGAATEYAAPVEPRDWWISRDAFDSLEFYKPATLTGRMHGWIGVSQKTGRIYIFTFTM
jgi:hypothetical protein